MDIIEVARWLNRAGVSAAPCPWLSALSIFVDERYENYDYDILGPQARLTIARVFKQNGLRRRGGRVFLGNGGRIEFPKPARSLSTTPEESLEDALRSEGSIALATPTQAIFLTLLRSGKGLEKDRELDLIELVFEHPANLNKITEWLRGTESETVWHRFAPYLASRQEEGCRLRAERAFHSSLPS